MNSIKCLIIGVYVHVLVNVYTCTMYELYHYELLQIVEVHVFIPYSYRCIMNMCYTCIWGIWLDDESMEIRNLESRGP